jgi:hypothetical protein
LGHNVEVESGIGLGGLFWDRSPGGNVQSATWKTKVARDRYLYSAGYAMRGDGAAIQWMRLVNIY